MSVVSKKHFSPKGDTKRWAWHLWKWASNERWWRSGRLERALGELDLLREKWWKVRARLVITKNLLNIVGGQWPGRCVGARRTQGNQTNHADHLFMIWGALIGWKSQINSSLLWGVNFLLKAIYPMMIYWPAERFFLAERFPRLCPVWTPLSGISWFSIAPWKKGRGLY